MTEMISLPRAVVEALVSPTDSRYFDDERGFCRYCGCGWTMTDEPPFADISDHAKLCPVRIAQEALRHASS